MWPPRARFASSLVDMTSKGKQKVAVGISGGVDSAVAALLLQKQGYDVTGVFMRNWDEREETGNSNCSIEADFRQAKKVCSSLSIDLLEANFVSKYWDEVFVNFLDRLRQGSTPNPDLDCNRFIKFSAFTDFAFNKGFDKIATGHYARISHTATNQLLLTGMDKNKDQSYFLASINPRILQNVLFPLGDLKKAQVRRIAEAHNLPPADRKSSTGICFIGNRNFKDFISGYIETAEGRFVDIDSGKDLGQCPNIFAYTYGQRPGIGGLPKKTYVVGKNVGKRLVYVAQGRDHDALYTRKARISELHWLSSTHHQTYKEVHQLDCYFKARYRQKKSPCTLRMKFPDLSLAAPSSYWSLEGDQQWSNMVEFQFPAFAITPQQAIVFYDGDICIASATIVSPCATLNELDDPRVFRGYSSSRIIDSP